MRLSFDQFKDQIGGRRVELVKEQIGFGRTLAIRKARELIERDKVDVVVGVVNSEVAADLRPIFEESRRVLIVTNVGANVVREADRSSHVFYNSLNYWQANRATGQWAADNLGRRAFVASSLYDSGYDSVYAFRTGFESAGGEVVDTYTTHVPPDSGDPAPLIAAIKKAKPDVVFGCYCGEPAITFVRAYSKSGLAKRIPLVGSGFMVDDDILPAMGRAAQGIRTAFPWASSLQTPENEAFGVAYLESTGRPADSFAVLGYDTGRLIIEALNAVRGDEGQSQVLIDALERTAFDSPRGPLVMDRSTHNAGTPLYLREVRQRGNTVGNTVITKLNATLGIASRCTTAVALGPVCLDVGLGKRAGLRM